ncbi:MAG: hypothetical protein PHN84_14385 [Desulfuromonadaceae bacterium]|nr:hypothetical protein [Desulfuromonadaceae bacterium]MDD2855330.1 hypothetical protein [Desulfuromonadaceae bacterium]
MNGIVGTFTRNETRASVPGHDPVVLTHKTSFALAQQAVAAGTIVGYDVNNELDVYDPAAVTPLPIAGVIESDLPVEAVSALYVAHGTVDSTILATGVASPLAATEADLMALINVGIFPK